MASFLDLSITVPGSAGGGFVRDFDINEVPLSSTVDDEEQDQDSGSVSGSKKLRLSQEQSRMLEQSFRENHSLNAKQKDTLASELRLKPRQVEVWFQNRRARTKLKQTELECSYLRRCFGSLTEENKRLHREVEQLRALRAVGPEATNLGGPASTMLTMCPRCERVTAISGGTDKVPTSNKALSVTNVHMFRQSRQRSAAC